MSLILFWSTETPVTPSTLTTSCFPPSSRSNSLPYWSTAEKRIEKFSSLSPSLILSTISLFELLNNFSYLTSAILALFPIVRNPFTDLPVLRSTIATLTLSLLSWNFFVASVLSALNEIFPIEPDAL